MFLREVISNLEAYSNKNALCIQDIFYSNSDLSDATAQIYWKLQDSTLKVNNCVGLVCEDDLYTYAAIFALWLSGKVMFLSERTILMTEIGKFLKWLIQMRLF